MQMTSLNTSKHIGHLARMLTVGLLGAAIAAGASLGPAPAALAAEQDDYIVVYKPGTSIKAEARSEEARGNDVERVFGSALKGLVAPLDRADVRRLESDPDVLVVERDGPVRALAAGPRDQSPATWGLDRVDQRALPLTNRIKSDHNGFGVDAYIIDSGLRADHTQFTGRVLPGFDAVGDGLGTGDCGSGHGSHVAGTVGGSTYGVAPQVNLIPVRVLGCGGGGSWAGLIAGINWMVARHTDGQPAVANMSLGGPKTTSVNMAVAGAHADGITMVVAAGNENSDACTNTPASEPTAITVGSTTSSDARSSFSNYGTCVDIFAPGSDIVSAGISSPTATGVKSGTSMASPHVAGAAALVLSRDPKAKPSQVAAALSGAATSGVVVGPGTGSPNRLLYLGVESIPPYDPGAEPAPPTSPAPAPAPAPKPPVAPKPPAPVNVAAPAVSGSPVVGSSLSAEPGSWQNSPTETSIQWYRCDGPSFDSDCLEIEGETSTAYMPSEDDIGSYLAVVVTASNAGGTRSIASNPVGEVASEPLPELTLDAGSELRIDRTGSFAIHARCSKEECDAEIQVVITSKASGQPKKKRVKTRVIARRNSSTSVGTDFAEVAFKLSSKERKQLVSALRSRSKVTATISGYAASAEGSLEGEPGPTERVQVPIGALAKPR